MHARHLIAVAVLVIAGSANAAEFVAPDAGFVSTKTRAEVMAELHHAYADGKLKVRDDTYPVIVITSGGKTREAVLAELMRYKQDKMIDHRYDY
jgi:hypothetical protein